MHSDNPVTNVLGVGHDSAATLADLLALAEAGLRRAGLAPGDLAAVASIDSRRKAGLVGELARHFAVPAFFYPAARLEMETPRLRHPSVELYRRIGCHGVAEAAALAAAGAAATLILPKQTGNGITCAIAGPGPNRP